jgi:bla regulator protein BlaR1
MEMFDLFNTPTGHALGISLYQSLWHAVAAFGIIQLILCWISNPLVRYRILYAALLLLFCSFVFTFIIQRYELRMAFSQSALSLQELGGGLEPGEQKSSGVQGTGLFSFSLLNNSGLYQRLLPFVTIGYCLGVLLLGSITIKRFVGLRSLRINTFAVPEHLQQCLQKYLSKLGLSRKVALRFSNMIDAPLMLGHFKPLILLPIAIVNNLSVKEVEAIIMHEVGHIKHNDYLLNILQVIVETLMFFNPIIWWLSRQIRKERELACDDISVKYFPHPEIYAHALFSLANAQMQAGTTAMAATGVDHKYQLLKRIKRITNMKSNNRNIPKRVVSGVSVIMIALATAGFFAAQAQDASQSKKSDRAQAKTKTTVVVKDMQGKTTKYQSTDEDSIDINATIQEVLKQAQDALSQVNVTSIDSAIKVAMIAIDKDEMKGVLKGALEEIEQIDWKQINKDIKESMQTIDEVDWKELGERIQEGLKEIEGLDEGQIKRAMDQVKKALEEAKGDFGVAPPARLKSMANDEMKSASQQVAPAQSLQAMQAKEFAAVARAIHQQRINELFDTNAHMKKGSVHRATLEKLRAEGENRVIAAKVLHEKAIAAHKIAENAAAASSSSANKLVDELSNLRLIKDSRNIDVRLTNKALYIDGEKQSEANFRSLKHLAPDNDGSEIRIKRVQQDK